jgi:hypothetical protein
LLADSGTWQVSGGVLQVAATSLHGDAVAVYQIGDLLPIYYEVTASIKTIKPTAGWNANSYIIFDYVSYQDFKFAGIDVSTNKLVIGHRDASGWVYDKFTPFQGKSDQYYSVLLSVNGLAATVVVDQKALTHTFNARVENDVSYGLNWGLVGFGSNNAQGAMDNIAVQVLPPQTNIVRSDDFSTAALGMFGNAYAGTWTVSSGRYVGTPLAGSDLAINMIDMSGVQRLSSTSALDLSAIVRATAGRTGFVFDRYDNGDFKWAGFDVGTQQVLAGHYTTRGGWAVDKAVSFNSLAADADFNVSIFVKGSTVTVTAAKMSGTTVVASAMASHVFNAAAVDGGFGLMAKGGTASFDKVTAKTDDTQVPQSLMASSATVIGSANATATISEADLTPLVDEALRGWSMSEDAALIEALRDLEVRIADLPGLELARLQDGMITIDADAAGYGWFVDDSPAGSGEFAIRLERNVLAAAPESEAFGRMDLLTVVTHEIGHVFGFDHDDAGSIAVMDDDLSAGVRYVLAASSSAPQARPAVEAQNPFAGGMPGFDLGAGYGGIGVNAGIDWQADSSGGWKPKLSPYASDKPVKSASPNFASFLVNLFNKDRGEAQGAGFDSMGRALLGKDKGR